MKRIEFDEKCKSCNGTGLYIGMGERDGIAVVCHNCKGTGNYHFVHEYEDFEERALRDDVKRVIETNPGYIVGEIKGDINWVGGMSYIEWINGYKFKPGMEMRNHTCPCWWYQCTDYDKRPDWEECWGTCSFSSCRHFKEKDRCWERWDKEFNKK